MGKSKMIAKSCPKCDLQVAVASKSCKCGHTFFSSRRSMDAVSPSDELRRRTSRVRRGKPQFYDSQDYQKQKKRSPKKRSLSRSWEDQADKAIQGKDKESAARARRRRALRRAQLETSRKEERGGGGGSRERTPQLRPAQLATCNIILAEINRKMGSVVWRPTVE